MRKVVSRAPLSVLPNSMSVSQFRQLAPLTAVVATTRLELFKNNVDKDTMVRDKKEEV